MNREEAKKKINALSAPNEYDVGNLLLDFELELVACGDESKVIKNDQEIGKIDLTFKDAEVEKIFLIEVSTVRTGISEKISHFFSRWSDEENIKIIRTQFALPPTYKIVRIFFEFSGKEEVPSSTTHLLTEENNILLKYDFDYFCDAFRKIGIWAKNDFFSYLKIRPTRRRTITDIPAIEFYLENARLYIYVDRVDQLLKYCYIFRRIKNDRGYQRVLEKGRIGNIAKKIEKGKLLAFPNTILISCPGDIKLCNNPREIQDCPSDVRINVPDYFCACRVIDGQHRLLGFARLPEDIQESHYLPVIAIEEIDQYEEMKTFIDINSTQKKIDRNLILVLQADFEWNKDDNKREFFEKIAVEVVKKLNADSALKGKIFIPEAMVKKERKITLNTLVTTTIGNNFIGGKRHLFQKDDNDIDTPHREIKEIFLLIQEKLPQYSRDISSFFLTNKGLRILFRLIQIYERNKLRRNISFPREVLIEDLESILNNQYVKKLEDYYGEGGVVRAVEEVVNSLKRNKRNRYNNFTTDLRKI